jgi:hypothetical protein
VSFSIAETDHWPHIEREIRAERDRRIGDLLYVATLDAMRKEQGFVEALDWVLQLAHPKPPAKSAEEDE